MDDERTGVAYLKAKFERESIETRQMLTAARAKVSVIRLFNVLFNRFIRAGYMYSPIQ